MRAVRSTRLVVVFAVLVAAMALSASSALAFSVSSSTASTQAGAPTDLTFTYAATGTQTLSRLDVDLPPGVMHDPSSTPACPVATFLTDRCPASSRVAHTATVITVAGAQVSVPGAVFHIADPADDSDFPLGIVLRPPLSALGLTGKIYLRDRVSFTNGGGLRHSITGPLSSVSVLGIPLRSRVTASRFTFTGHSERGNQTYNSTSCATTQLRATATFSDGRTEERTSPYRTTGCDKLIFTGGFEFRGGQIGAPKKSFAAKLGGVARAPAGVTHEYHRVGAQIDLSEVGDWDTSELANEPVCTNAEFITNTCPIRSQIGTVTTGVEGFPGTKTGAIFTSYPRGAKPRGRIELRPGVTATFTLDMVTSADGRASLEIDGLPQLPLTDISIDVSSPVFVPKSKPASCSSREARAVISGHSGGWSLASQTFPAEPCPPSIAIVDPRDEDADGDGFADDEIRAENFPLKIIVTAEGQEIDTGKSRCELSSPDPAQAVRGKVKIVRDTGNGYTCEVSEAAGQVTVSFFAASVGGHVTVLKRSYTIDSEAPVVDSAAPEVIESDSTNVALAFTFTDDLIGHPQSEYDIECVIEDSSGARHTTTPGHKYIDRTLRKGGGECMWDTGRSGRFRLEIVVRDSGGHVTVLKRTAVVDAQGPVITLSSYRDGDSDHDGHIDEEIRLPSFEIPFTVGGDNDIDDSSVSCKLINPVAMDKGLRVADLDGDGRADVCLVADAPGGPITVEISAADYRGHVTVLKLAYEIDTEPPAYETTAPGKVVYDLSTFDYEFEFSDDTLTNPQSKFKAGVEIEVGLGYASNARIITDRDSGRSKGFARFENIPDGTHPVTVTIEDSTGHVTVLKHTITVDTTGPVITLVNPEGIDSDGDGTFEETRYVRSFDRAVSVQDHADLDKSSVKCTVRGWDPTTKQTVVPVDLSGDGLADVCRFTDVPDGLHELEVSAADYRGHVTVLKAAITVEATPPEVTILSPFTGQTFSSGTTMTTRFTAVGESPLEFVCMIDSFVMDAACSESETFSLGGLSLGTHTFTVTARDSRGRSSSSSVAFNIAAPSPDVCAAIVPPPPGCPGSGGPIITLP